MVFGAFVAIIIAAGVCWAMGARNMAIGLIGAIIAYVLFITVAAIAGIACIILMAALLVWLPLRKKKG